MGSQGQEVPVSEDGYGAADVVSVNGKATLDDGNSKDSSTVGKDDTISVLLKRMSELDQKVKEMEEKIQKDTENKTTDSDDSKPEDNASESGDDKEESDTPAFGSLPNIKLAPYDGNEKTYVTTRKEEAQAYAIVARYDVPPSREKGLELSAYDVEGMIPTRVAINSKDIISLLRTVSGTSIKDEPCVVIPPYKLFVDSWDAIQAKVKELEDAFAEAYPPEVEDAPKSPECTAEVASVLTEEETKAKEEKEKKDKKQAEILHGRCLVRFISTYLKDVLDLRASIRSGTTQTISFDNLWHLFSPGDIVLGREPFGQHQRQAYQVFSVMKGRYKMKDANSDSTTLPKSPDRNALQLQCFFLDYDGACIDTREQMLEIRPYVGEKKITELDFYPMAFYKESPSCDVIGDLWKRSLRFLQYRYGHGACDCITSRYKLEHVDSEVFVDFKSGYEDQPEWKSGQFGVVKLPECTNEETYESSCSVTNCMTCSNCVYLDEQIDGKRSEAVREKLPKRIPEDKIDALRERVERAINNKDKKALESELRHVILLPRHLLVYSLRTKQWHFIDARDFQAVHITDKERAEGFNNLVIDENHKRLLKAMVNDHAGSMTADKKSSFSRSGTSIDIVRGKGRGRIIFLYGPPGVGKTSTAETIAAFTKPPRPLYPITCGDLGSDPITIQARLEAHFKLAHRWNCVLLLDEADVYLAERHHTDLSRNGIVSVFLRILEYYSGILFLTSNREGSIDPAFKSRIHLALRYKKIDRDGTQRIWKNILTGIAKDNANPDKKIKVEFDEADLLKWAGEHYDSLRQPASYDEDAVPTWNGRQIRNAFQSALALASYERAQAMEQRGLTEEMALRNPKFRRIVLRRKHFEDISKVVKVFEQYLIKCGRGDDNADKEGLRVDDFDDPSRSAYDGFEPPLSPRSSAAAPTRNGRPAAASSTRKGQRMPPPPRRQSTQAVLGGGASGRQRPPPVVAQPRPEPDVYEIADTPEIDIDIGGGGDDYGEGDYDDMEDGDYGDPASADGAGDDGGGDY